MPSSTQSLQNISRNSSSLGHDGVRGCGPLLPCRCHRRSPRCCYQARRVICNRSRGYLSRRRCACKPRWNRDLIDRLSRFHVLLGLDCNRPCRHVLLGGLCSVVSLLHSTQSTRLCFRRARIKRFDQLDLEATLNIIPHLHSATTKFLNRICLLRPSNSGICSRCSSFLAPFVAALLKPPHPWQSWHSFLA
jgi:hypothetical protein